jgi:hypothetical protein
MDETTPHGHAESFAAFVERDRLDRERAKAFREELEADDDELDEARDQHEEERTTTKASGKGVSTDDWFKEVTDDFFGATPRAEPTDQPEPEGNTPTAEAEPQPTNETEPVIRKHRQRRPAPARKLPHGHCTGVWIPKAVYEDPRFESLTEMLLYLEINHLDNTDGCIARNQHFAEYLGCNVQTIQDMIRSMAEREILFCVYPSRTRRVIHIAGGKKSYPRHRG